MGSSRKELESFIKLWNVKFPYDRLWRKKYNIPFFSEAHLKASQIDIYLDLLEDRFIDRIQNKYIQSKKDKDDYYNNGVILKEDILTPEEEEKLFKSLKFPKQDE